MQPIKDLLSLLQKVNFAKLIFGQDDVNAFFGLGEGIWRFFGFIGFFLSNQLMILVYLCDTGRYLPPGHNYLTVNKGKKSLYIILMAGCCKDLVFQLDFILVRLNPNLRILKFLFQIRLKLQNVSWLAIKCFADRF